MNATELQMIKSALCEALDAVTSFEGDLVSPGRARVGKVSKDDFQAFFGGYVTEKLRCAIKIVENHDGNSRPNA